MAWVRTCHHHIMLPRYTYTCDTIIVAIQHMPGRAAQGQVGGPGGGRAGTFLTTTTTLQPATGSHTGFLRPSGVTWGLESIPPPLWGKSSHTCAVQSLLPVTSQLSPLSLTMEQQVTMSLWLATTCTAL